MMLDKSAINDHFSHVEQFMLGDGPSDPTMLKSIWLSFAKVVKAPTVSDASRQLLNHINMEIVYLIFNHNMHQCRYHSTTTDLKQLRQLEAQKSTYTTKFQATKAERKVDLVKQERLNKRIINLIA